MATLTSEQLADLRGDIGITNAIQVVTITGTPTGGTFTLTYKGATTSAIAYNAVSSAVQTALQALSTIGSGGATVAGGAGGPYTVTFAVDGVALLTGSGAGLTGGSSPSVSIAINVVFTDDELHRLYTRADEDYDTAVVYALRQLLAQAAKFHNYTVGQTKIEKKQVRDNLANLLDRWESIAGVNAVELESGTISLGIDMTEDDLEEWESEL